MKRWDSISGLSTTRWCKLLKLFPLRELSKVAQFVLSVPISNSYAERIFSVMGFWKAERSRMSADLVKAELPEL